MSGLPDHAHFSGYFFLKKQPYSKSPLLIKDQIELLKTSLLIPNKKQVARYLQNISYFDWFEKLYELVFQDIGIDLLHEVIKPVAEEMNQQTATTGRHMMKVCCFTEINTNLAMWAHYAKDFTGICVEYDMTMFAQGDIRRIRMFPVYYDKELIDYTARFAVNPSSKWY